MSEQSPYDYFWPKVSEILESRTKSWGLIQSTQENVRYFLQMGRHGGQMRLCINPRNGDKNGIVEIAQLVGPSDLKCIQEFLQAHPEFIFQEPYRSRGHFRVAAAEKSSADAPENETEGYIYYQATIVSEMTPEIMDRIAKWFVDCWETICTALDTIAQWKYKQTNPEK